MGDDALTIPGLLATRRRLDPERRALVTVEDEITYTELDDASAAMARRLVAAGIGKGSRVGLVMANGIEWATTAFAVMRVGGVLVPLSTLLRPPELVAQLQAAAVTHLIVERSHRGRHYPEELEAAVPGIGRLADARGRLPLLPSLRRLWVGGAVPDEQAPAELVAAMEARVVPADDMVILFTSGSRGAPKGTIHTHGSALRAVGSGLGSRCVNPGERLYIPMPFFWTGGFSGGLISAVLAGATLLTEAIPEPARTLALLERERATLFRGWPDQAARIAAHPDFPRADLSSLGPASLSAVLPPDRRARPGARANLFGMTESFGPYCGAPLDVDLPPGGLGSCGRPFAGVEVRIIDPGSGVAVAVGDPGEITLRGPNLMRGMAGRTREEVFSPDGWYRTGDLGRLDADGYLFYSGRLDDMFKVKGATVYPNEVESGLRAVPGVSQAFVTDVTGDGGVEQVGAVVIGPDPASLAEVADHARSQLSSFKVPTCWLALASADDLPMSATGKVDKAGLQALLRRRGTTLER